MTRGQGYWLTAAIYAVAVLCLSTASAGAELEARFEVEARRCLADGAFEEIFSPVGDNCAIPGFRRFRFDALTDGQRATLESRLDGVCPRAASSPAGEGASSVIGQVVRIRESSRGGPDGWEWILRSGGDAPVECQYQDVRDFLVAFDQVGTVAAELEVRRDEGVSISFDTTDDCILCNRPLTVCDFDISPETAFFSSVEGRGGTAGLRVSTFEDCGWSVRSTEEFLTVESVLLPFQPPRAEPNGEGDGEVVYRVADFVDSEIGDVREAELKLGRRGLLERTLTVTQEHTEGSVLGGTVERTEHTIMVPENRADPASRLIPLDYQLSGEVRTETPLIVHLGSAVVPDLGEFGTVVTVAPRQRLDCTNRVDAWPLGAAEERIGLIGLFQDASEVCVSRLSGTGTEVAFDTLLAAADDLEDLRLELGGEQFVLVGRNQGAQLALVYLWRYPSNVDRVILGGVRGLDQTLTLPSDVQRVLERLGTQVRNDRGGYGRGGLDLQLLDTVAELLVELEGEVIVDDVTLGALDLQRTLAARLVQEGGLETIPRLIVEMQAGDFSSLADEARERRARARLGRAFPFIFPCSSLSRDRERIHQEQAEDTENLLADALDLPRPGVCSAWGEGLDLLRDSFPTSLTSEVPILFVSASLDAKAPVEQAQELRSSFARRCELLLIRGTHQNVLGSLPTLESQLAFETSVRAFMEDGERCPLGAGGPARIELPALDFEPLVDNEAQVRSLAAPRGLRATVAGPNGVLLQWRHSADREVAFDVVMRRRGGRFRRVATVLGGSTRAEIGGLRSRTTYLFRVRARRGGVRSAFSNRVRATLLEDRPPKSHRSSKRSAEVGH